MNNSSAQLPAVSIIIITLNEETRLPRLLAQIEQQTYQDIQLIVSDSNSTDTTRQAAEAYNHVGHNFTFHQCGVTKWPGYGRNRWAEQATEDLLLFLDADTQLPHEKFLEDTITYFVKHHLDVAGCYIQPNTKSILHSIWSRLSNGFFFVMKHTKKPLLVWWFILVKKKVHEHIGGFDEVMYLGEDSEYARQAKVLVYKFRLMPYRFIFDMRRIREKWALHAIRTYLTWFVLLLRQKKMLYTDAKKKVDYEYDIYKKQ